MELIGTVEGAGPSGEILVRVSRPWRWGDGPRLVDRRGRALGRVTGVIGPAAAPWLVVRPLGPAPGRDGAVPTHGTNVYLEEQPEAEKVAASRGRTKGRPTGRSGRRRRG